MNIVLERLELADDERFDLIFASSLVDYGLLEQALALANISTMLRPGGFFLTNQPAFPAPPMATLPTGVATMYDGQPAHVRGALLWFQQR